MLTLLVSLILDFIYKGLKTHFRNWLYCILYKCFFQSSHCFKTQRAYWKPLSGRGASLFAIRNSPLPPNAVPPLDSTL